MSNLEKNLDQKNKISISLIFFEYPLFLLILLTKDIYYSDLLYFIYVFFLVLSIIFQVFQSVYSLQINKINTNQAQKIKENLLKNNVKMNYKKVIFYNLISLGILMFYKFNPEFGLFKVKLLLILLGILALLTKRANENKIIAKTQ